MEATCGNGYAPVTSMPAMMMMMIFLSVPFNCISFKACAAACSDAVENDLGRTSSTSNDFCRITFRYIFALACIKLMMLMNG